MTQTYAPSTQKAYRTHRRSYLAFCAAIGVDPVPASSNTLCRYAAMLARTLKFTSIKQYMNIIRLLHREWELPNPLTDNFQLDCVLRGIKRGLGDTPSRKLPITPALLLQFLGKLDLRSPTDSAVWAAALLLFFGLLRRNNALCSPSTFDPEGSLRRQDISVHEWGMLVRIRRTKTIQNKERCLMIPLPRMPSHRLCPVQAIFHAFSLTPGAPSDGPAFVLPCAAGFRPLSPAAFVSRIRSLVSLCGEDSTRYAGHSFRRGGASWAYSSGVPVDTIRILGDWRSQAYTAYISPNLSCVRDSIKQMITHTK